MADERFERRLTHEAAAVRQEIAGVRMEIAGVRQEVAVLRQDVSSIAQQMVTRQDLAVVVAQVAQKIGDSRAELIKWSFLFWIGQFLTTIGFLLVLLRRL